MKKNSGWRFLGLIICTLLLLENPIKVQASQMNGMDFTVRAILPENQRNSSKAYFDLLMEPGKQQTLEVEITNNAQIKKTIRMDVCTATTNSSGEVDYGIREHIEADQTLPFQMTELVSAPESVTLEAGETTRVQLAVSMPEETFDGVLAGGINFREEVVEEESEETDGGVSIINEYSFVIGLLLRQNETLVNPELILNEVKATQKNYKNVVSANIQNIHSMYVNEMNVNAAITKEGEETVLYELHQEQMQMAPNSNFNYLIGLNGERFEAGNYQLSLDIDSNNGSWHFDKVFTITAEEAKELNEADVSIEKKNYPWLLVAVGGVILLLLLIIFGLILKMKRNNRSINQS